MTTLLSALSRVGRVFGLAATDDDLRVVRRLESLGEDLPRGGAGPTVFRR